VYIWFPFGLTYLAAIAIGAAVGWLLGNAAYRIFGYGILKPFDLVSDLIGDAAWYIQEWYRRHPDAGGREAEVMPEPEKPVDTSAGGSPAGLDEAEKALTGRRKEGD
jgi:hypothetical protein